jgi:hypothetical protein
MATADELKISLNSFFTSEDANTIAGYKTQYITTNQQQNSK